MKRMRSSWFPGIRGATLLLFGVFGVSGVSGVSWCQTPSSPKPDAVVLPEVLNFETLKIQGLELLKKAEAGSGSSGVTLAQYRNHYTMLTARTKSGGAEVHKNFADFLIVLDGEGTELTGGTVVEGRDGPNGEIRGTRLEGAMAHPLHAGDVIHIPAGTPHQAIEAAGQHITIYVIKVQETSNQP